jgi:hypothetical protein
MCLLFVTGSLSGCGDSTPDSTGPGPIDSGLHHDAVLANQQRLAGEDVRVVPLYKTPLEAVGVGFNVLIGQPIVNFFDYITHDNLAYATRNMENSSSPDKQREGLLRMTDFKRARQGIYLNGYAIFAREGQDFTIRAAGIRALNRCRAQGHTLFFLQCLGDEEPLIQLEAADALSNIPDPRAIPTLISQMQDQAVDVDVRIACADALRCYHSPQVTDALAHILDDSEFGLVWQARQSLELLTGQDFRYDAKAWLNYLSATGT